MFTGADRRGATNCQVGIPPAFIIATFIDPRRKNIQNLSQADETSKDSVKFKVLELKKLDEAGARVASQLLLSFATFAFAAFAGKGGKGKRFAFAFAMMSQFNAIAWSLACLVLLNIQFR